MKLHTKTLLTALTATATLTAGSANAAVIYGVTDVTTLDYSNVVGAWNFGGTNVTVQGVTFAPISLDGTTGTLTLGGALNGGGSVGSNKGLSVTTGGNATDQTNLTAIYNATLNGQQGGVANDLTIAVSGLASSTYTVQILVGHGNSRSNEVFAEGNSIGEWQTSGATNLVMTEDVVVTDGTLNLVFGEGSTGTDQRRLISGLIISAVPEPGSLALLGLGGLLIGARRRRG